MPYQIIDITINHHNNKSAYQNTRITNKRHNKLTTYQNS